MSFKQTYILLSQNKCSDKKSYLASTMGTSQSKRSNKISKLRTSSVGAVGDFAEENEGNSKPNSIGKLSSKKGKYIQHLNTLNPILL